MKRILTLIVTLVCVFAAYSQNTVYIWKGNTLSVQAADSLTIDRSHGDYVDLGLSVLWAKYDIEKWKYSNGNCLLSRSDLYDIREKGYVLPTPENFDELYRQCANLIGTDSFTIVGKNGNAIYGVSPYYPGSGTEFGYWIYNEGDMIWYINKKYGSWSNPWTTDTRDIAGFLARVRLIDSKD